MSRIVAVVAAFLWAGVGLEGAEYHVTPSGTSAGNGSLSSPWDMATALRGPAGVNPGDTIWLRAGVYRGRFISRLSGTSASPIIVRAYPGERVTLDGNYSTSLTSNLGSGTAFTAATVTVADASLMESGLVISVGGEEMQIDTRTGNTLTVIRGWNGTCSGSCTGKSAGAAVRLESTSLTVEGDYTWYWGFELTNSGHATRLSTVYGSEPRGGGVNWNNGLDDRCNGCKYINLVANNIGANGMFSSQAARNTEFHGNLLYYNGWQGPGEGDGKGHGIYAQNSSTSKRITDNLSFWNFGYGLQIYGSENALLDNFTVSGNFIFNNGEPTLLGVIRNLWIGGSNPPRNLGLTQNVTYFHSTISNQGQNFLGEGSGCQNTTVTGNRFLQLNSPLELGSGCVPALTGNVLWGNQMISAGAFPGNTYIAPGSRPSGQEVVVRPNAYEAGRAHIAVLNWSRASSVAVDLSGVLSAGNTYEIRDAQNYFGPAVVSGTYDGSLVNIPMNLTAIASPVGLVSKLPVHTSNEIGFFVLVRTSGADHGSILDLHVPPPASRGAIINWRTSQAATCFVAYGSPEPGWRTRPVTRIKHSEALTQLEPGTQYSFRVECRAGDTSFPAVTGTFRTAPPDHR
jgi:hypothetical protein